MLKFEDIKVKDGITNLQNTTWADPDPKNTNLNHF
jgi:hypothetical protein